MTDQTQQPCSFALLFQAPDPDAFRAARSRSEDEVEEPRGAERSPRRRSDEDDQPTGRRQRGEGRGRRSRGERGGRGRGDEGAEATSEETPEQERSQERDHEDQDDEARGEGRVRRRRPDRRRRRGEAAEDVEQDADASEAPEASEERDREDSADDESEGGRGGRRARRRRGGRGRGQADEASREGDEGTEQSDEQRSAGADDQSEDDTDHERSSRSRRSRKRSRGGRRRSRGEGGEQQSEATGEAGDEVTRVQGSTRLAAKKQRRREGREAGRKRTVLTEAEFLARRESVERTMLVRQSADYTQVGVLEDGVLVEHYIDRKQQTTMVGNVYLGRVQNVLPSMEAAFVDIGKGRNGVLYAGEVNWEAAGLPKGEQKRIEAALQPGQAVLVQVTKDPIGHKGARLTAQVSLPGRYLVYVPGNTTTGISRKLPDTERARLKKILKDVVPAEAGVIVRTAAEGASEAELRADVERLTAQWERIAATEAKGSAPVMVHGEPDLTTRVIRDVFNEDFGSLVVSGDRAWDEVNGYVDAVAPDLSSKLKRWEEQEDLFDHFRVQEQIAKAMDRKVWLPSGGSLIIDRTEAMTVIDVNTGKFVGSGGNLEETVTKNNIEAAEEIVRQLRLRDIGGIIVVDFIDMVLESNRDLVVRRLVECLARDRTKHQVAEVTSLGLVQMTRKRVGSGLVEVYGEECQHCDGHGLVVKDAPVAPKGGGGRRSGRGQGGGSSQGGEARAQESTQRRPSGPSVAQIARAVHAAALKGETEGGVPVARAEDMASTPQAAPEGPAAESAQPVPAPQQVSEPESEAAASPGSAPEAVAPAEPAPVVTGRIGRRPSVPVEPEGEGEPYVGAPVADAAEPAPAATVRRSTARRVARTAAGAPSVEAPAAPAATTSVAGGAGVAETSTVRRRAPRRRAVAPQGGESTSA